MSDPKHPIYGVLRTAIIAAVAIFALWHNYERMDSRDIWTVMELVVASAGIEWMRKT